MEQEWTSNGLEGELTGSISCSKFSKTDERT